MPRRPFDASLIHRTAPPARPQSVDLADISRLRLGVDIDGPEVAFRYHDTTGWESFGPTLDATILSDEHAIEVDQGQVAVMGFTGAFVGLWVWDLYGRGHPADFDDTRYFTRAADNGDRH
jgi:xylan 1,4-beta-xylosidase